MNTEKLSGYPSIDKPWLKYYTKEQINKKLPEMTLKSYLLQSNKDNKKRIALNYFGTKITYNLLFQKIEETKVAFKKIGLKEGDVVSIVSPFLPEVVFAIYAINALGGVVNMIDPRTPDKKLLHYYTISKTKYSVILSSIYEKAKKIENEVLIKKNIIISPSESLPFQLKVISKVKNKQRIKSSPKYILWKDFLKNCTDKRVKDAKYNKNKPAVIVYTSGTSGEPKGAVLSNESINSLGYTQGVSLNHTTAGDKFLLIMPPFIAYGLAVGLHGQLLRGQELIMIPSFTVDNSKEMLGSLVCKYKPQTIMGVPSFMVDLIEHEKMIKSDCKFLKDIIVGGDSMTRKCEKRVNSFFAQKGCDVRITKGWGLTEVSSGFSYTKDRENNLIGSVGIPLVGNNIKIVRPIQNENFDFAKLEELSYNEIGEIFINAPSIILDYLDNEEESKKVFFKDEKGNRWVRTQDLGRISEDGIIFIEGRLKRIIIRPDGHNISPFAIENVINKTQYVEACAVVGSRALNVEHGSYAIAYIELKDKYKNKQEEILKEIKERVEEELPARDVANRYIVIDKIPLTGIGKIDYKDLEQRKP